MNYNIYQPYKETKKQKKSSVKIINYLNKEKKKIAPFRFFYLLILLEPLLGLLLLEFELLTNL